MTTPMTPWGTRLQHATAVKRDMPRLDIQLNWNRDSQSADRSVPIDGSERSDSGSLPLVQAEFEVRLTNTLPVELSDCWLILGVTRAMDDEEDRDLVISRASRWNSSTSIDGLIDVYHFEALNQLAAGADYQATFDADFFVKVPWEMERSWPGGALRLARLPRMGTAGAWIVGRLSKSPVLKIDEGWTDFTVNDEIHLFLQELQSEEIEDLTALMKMHSAQP